MPRTVSVVEITQFNAGLITDRSPLTSQDNSSLEEENFNLNIDGSRNRRLGMDFEDDYQEITTTTINGGTVDLGTSSYTWNNAGGDPQKKLLVVQFGREIKVFDLDIIPISSGLIYTFNFASAAVTQEFSYAVVDGILVVATGLKEINKFEYNTGTITNSTSRLLIRDLFGVEDIISGVDITRGTTVQNRPTTLPNNHLYNLRNQSFGIPRLNANNETLADPISVFLTASVTKYPSNSDTVIEALYNDAQDTDNRTVDRFFPKDLLNNPLGTSRAAQGYFIIDALDRGISRLANEAANRTRYTELNAVAVTDLPDDITPGGPTAVTEFAGRVWYGGFPGEVVDGDSYSPKMSSYVLFSKVVDSAPDIISCYQEGDPTSKNNPDIIDTDGGFIRLNGAYGIKALINLGSSLMVVASNGVWRILGGDNGFTATEYIVERITDRGASNSDSIVVVDNTFMYWGDDAIYHVRTDQFGAYAAANITIGKIQALYNTIPVEDKRHVRGQYDSYERKVRWLYYNRTTVEDEGKELVLYLDLQAFSLNSIKQLAGNVFPKAVSLYKGNPYRSSLTLEQIVVNSEDVEVNGDEAVIDIGANVNTPRLEIGYIVVTQVNPVIKYSFATYSNVDFIEWYSYDNVGVDATAFMVTSYLSGTDFQRDKQVPYITAHFRRTENGYITVGDDLIPTRQSSCFVQIRWNWSNSNNSGKWGREFQAYRPRRFYMPPNDADLFDNGFATVVSRNKIRGNGKVLSIKWSTEPLKDCHLYGWSMIFSVAESI